VEKAVGLAGDFCGEGDGMDRGGIRGVDIQVAGSGRRPFARECIQRKTDRANLSG
jgi:hypothetical protein